MLTAIASRIDLIEPERILITTREQVRIRVAGCALGYVRCGRERRFAWGAFDETFWVRPERRAIEVRAQGLGGSVLRRVSVGPLLDLSPPRVREARPRTRFVTPTPPRLSRLNPSDLLPQQSRKP